MGVHLPIVFLLLAGCSGHASREDRLNVAANQSTPEAAKVLAGVAEKGMTGQAALNEAAEAQAANSSVGPSPRMQARPNSARNPNPPRPGVPPRQVPVNSSSEQGPEGDA